MVHFKSAKKFVPTNLKSQEDSLGGHSIAVGGIPFVSTVGIGL